MKKCITKERCDDIDSTLNTDQHLTEQLVGIMTQIQGVSEKVTYIIAELQKGNKRVAVQALYSIAVVCKNKYVRKCLFAVYYSVAAEVLPTGCFKELSLDVANNFKSAAALGLAPVVLTVLMMAYLRSASKSTKALKAVPAEVEAEVETVEAAEVEAIEITEFGAVELGQVAVGISGCILFASGIYHCVSAIKEMKEVGKIRDATQNLKKSKRPLQQYHDRKRTSDMRLLASLAFAELEIDAGLYLLIKSSFPDKCLSASVSVSTFNIKGTTVGDEYKEFLKEVFITLNCDLHHIQECLWNPWSKNGHDILAGYSVESTSTEEIHAGIASDLSSLTRKDMGISNSFLSKRSFFSKFSAIMTYECLTRKQSAIPLKFLSFSFHGSHKVTDGEKVQQISQFFEFVIKCCRAEELPAIVGGDFNYDIRMIEAIQKDVRIFGEPVSVRVIDYLCIVCGYTFETKMTMSHEGKLDITKLPSCTESIRDKITNHLPRFGYIHLYKKL